jgi:hypothetical protein
MDAQELLAAIRELDRPQGDSVRWLRIGQWRFALVGLDAALAQTLDLRWGGFLSRQSDAAPRLVIHVMRGEGALGLGAIGRGERYRLEASFEADVPLVRSYHFALCPGEDADEWRCALIEPVGETTDRVMENVLRYLVARVAILDGGFALHGAGVVRGGRAFLFAGPSRSGKTTAVRLSGPDRSLGDDFAVVLPWGAGWGAPAVPFDNSEEAPPAPAWGPFPVAGIWRLFHGAEARVESVPVAKATASLLGCTAFPWALADLTAPMIQQVRRFVEGGGFAHLRFSPASELWPLLEPAAR